MKLYSKDGTPLVNIKSLAIKGDDLVVKAKLMNAYNTDIILTPHELFSAKDLLGKGIIRHVIGMFLKGRKAKPLDEKKPEFTA